MKRIKYITRIVTSLTLSLLLIPLAAPIFNPQSAQAVSTVQAQSFNYDGVYLTDEEDRAIKGYEFDAERELLRVFIDDDRGLRNADRAVQLKLLPYNMRTGSLNAVINPDITNEEIEEIRAEHQSRYGVDMQAVYKEVAEQLPEIDPQTKKQNYRRTDVVEMVEERVPGIYQRDYGMLIVRPHIYPSSNLWIVEVLGHRVLRFEMSNDLNQIVDDYNVTYYLEGEE